TLRRGWSTPSGREGGRRARRAREHQHTPRPRRRPLDAAPGYLHPMTGRRLPLLVLLVTGLVAIVALVAHGRPLAASAGRSGVPASFWSYVLTSAVILFALVGLVILASLFAVRMEWTKPQTSFTLPLLRGLFGLLVVGLFLVYLARHHHLPQLQQSAP